MYGAQWGRLPEASNFNFCCLASLNVLGTASNPVWNASPLPCKAYRSTCRSIHLVTHEQIDLLHDNGNVLLKLSLFKWCWLANLTWNKHACQASAIATSSGTGTAFAQAIASSQSLNQCLTGSTSTATATARASVSCPQIPRQLYDISYHYLITVLF